MISSTETVLENNTFIHSLKEFDNCFLSFNEDISGLALPEKFTYPFDYQPHPLCIVAAKELQKRIQTLPHLFDHEDEEKESLGKMFGVLVVKNHQGNLGYLAAFSGKLFGGNKFEGFVPPVFDTLDPEGFYKKAEEEITQINIKIKELEEDAEYIRLQEHLMQMSIDYTRALTDLKNDLKLRKAARNQIRENLADQNDEHKAAMIEKLNYESAGDHYKLKDFQKEWKTKKETLEQKLDERKQPIEELKLLRRQMSADLQYRLHQEYHFMNALGEQKNLLSIFEITEENIPPSGAGECAAPKLLHYAYVHGYEPVAMAEFWWGASPVSEIRKHGHYYPACKSKCKPILHHMLNGLKVEDSPMEATFAQPKELTILFEDDYLMVIIKPSGLLSVPGKEIVDSVQTRVSALHPSITSPMIVHRLDMSTSGLMVLAKDLPTYHHLQAQFTNKKIVKKYEAILDGELSKMKGEINLPLRVDLDNRPRQLVCHTYGKPALTHYEVKEIKNGKTLIDFYPVTGRTHQLRVHSAHTDGLNTPILGDDLYGRRSDRLYLHAAFLQFTHPISKEIIVFTLPSEFEI